MADTKTLIEQAYSAFNARDIDGALALMTPDVRWPKASEGGTVVGKDEIRAYWTRQWSEFDPHVEPLAITEGDGGKVRVRVRQLVKSLEGDVLSDSEVLHIFTMKAGRIAAMDLGDDADPTGPSAAFAHPDQKLVTLLDGLAFPEGARWHDGALYFSDMHDGIVWRLTPDGHATKLLALRTLPSGLGWMPDGSFYVVSMEDRRLLRLNADGSVAVVADLSALSPFVINDMVIDGTGRAYIGTFGCDFNNGDPPRPTQVFCVHPDGRVTIAADGIMFPNGAVITPDNRRFIVAETFGECLSAYDIEPDGTLSNRRVFGGFPGLAPDGICLDAEGGVWVACLGANRIIRMIEGGAITDTIPLPGRDSYACALGGADRRDLYICTARSYVPSETRVLRSGRIEVVRVAIPGAGFP